MKNCLNIKCRGNFKLLYDYGSNYNFEDINFDCTTTSYSKPKIYKCNICELKFSELAVALSNKKIEALGWKPKYTLDQGIVELIKVYKMLKINSFANV